MNLDQRNYAIAKQHYLGEKTYSEIAREYNLSRERVAQIYSKFARQAVTFFKMQENHPGYTITRGNEFALLTERFVEISGEAALANIERHANGNGGADIRWHEDFNGRGKSLGHEVQVMAWVSNEHYVTMIRKIMYPDGLVCWQANAHFIDNDYNLSNKILKKDLIITSLTEERLAPTSNSCALHGDAGYALILVGNKVFGKPEYYFRNTRSEYTTNLHYLTASQLGLVAKEPRSLRLVVDQFTGQLTEVDAGYFFSEKEATQMNDVLPTIRVVDKIRFEFGQLADAFQEVEGYGGILAEFIDE